MWFALLLAVLLWGCSNSENVPSSENSHAETVLTLLDSLPGMVHIVSTDSSVVIGTNDTLAKQNERPQMTVEFGYDFAISRHEVTCAEYNALMKNQLACENDSVPATNMTFFDAVLYANELSKSEGRDTAYTYSSVNYNYEGRCTGLEGYAFHPEAKAYRLPTEAEWIYVANRGWDASDGWTAENSDYVLHEICSKGTNIFGVCDMLGNAAEWVNDWLGAFLDTTVVNFTGAPGTEGVGERIIKGGSFRNNRANIKISNRGDVYMVSSSTKTDYVGFRLAFGDIPNPTWIDRAEGGDETKVVPVRGMDGKLVFRNDLTGNLVYIDFTKRGTPAVVEFRDYIDAYHPDISPDGKWVAFCTGVEGIHSISRLFVRSLESDTAKPIELDFPTASIPRWRVLDSGDTVIVFVTGADNNEDVYTFIELTTWQVRFSNGTFGTPELLLMGNFHGGISDDNHLAVTGSTLLRARYADFQSDIFNIFVDTVWYNREQACNVSLSKDGTKRTAFLDFGGKTGREFAGVRYRTHERLLIANAKGELIESIGSPAGYSFDHTEWAGKGIVGTLADVNGNHGKIVYIDLEDSSIVTLVEGKDLWHPALWLVERDIHYDPRLDLDSAGAYYNENSEDNVYVLREKMQRFWEQKDSVTLVALGSSRVMFGIYNRAIPSQVTLNMGFPRGDLFDAKNLFEDYVLNHAKKVKYMFIEIAPDMFYRSESEDWMRVYNNQKGFKYDANHNFWKDSIPEGFIERVAMCMSYRYEEYLPYDPETFMYPPRSWGHADILNDSLMAKDYQDRFHENYLLFKRMLDKAENAGIKVIGIIFPRHPDYKNTGTFGAYGPMRSVAKAVRDSISKWNIVVMDENKGGDHDYPDEMAYDYDHLSILGAEQVSRRLDSLIVSLEKGKAGK